MMDAKTLKALKGSIAKWKAIAKGTGIERGAENCPLCKLFFWDDCKGCPVEASTGSWCCEGTPFDDEWAQLRAPDIRDAHGFYAVSDKAKAIAQKEVAFLESLLPAKAPS
jgi:hypothetical protein